MCPVACRGNLAFIILINATALVYHGGSFDPFRPVRFAYIPVRRSSTIIASHLFYSRECIKMYIKWMGGECVVFGLSVGLVM